MTTERVMCSETVGEPPHYLHEHDCRNQASNRVRYHGADHDVCGTHTRSLLRHGGVLVAERWGDEWRAVIHR